MLKRLNSFPEFVIPTDSSVDCAKEDCKNDEPPIPDMIVMDRAHAEEHENDGFG